jgi:general secretion pathway protein E
VNGLLAQAVEVRASDVHLEPGEREFTVRMRIDGVLHDRQRQPMSRYAAVASRVKLVSGLDIAERRLPQDGRTSIRVAGAEMDLRVSVIPAVHGEAVVLRLLPKRRADLTLERLGMEPDHLAMFRRWMKWPNGLILVTGPTGSGKSTTLYGALNEVNGTQRKVVTVEDPVELQVPHVVQIQTLADIGYTFARALRSILRHDPDIIMVGEIRDRETAEIAVQAALTGHLVLATLHTNDALSAVTRLTDMGIEPYLVAACLRAVMAQRLVRQLCEACALDGTLLEPQESDVRAAHGKWGGSGRPVRLRAAAGCPRCQGTGYRGRVAIYELVEIAARLQQLISAGADVAQLEAAANERGRRSLYQDGLLKVADGRTTLAEVGTASNLAFESA